MEQGTQPDLIQPMFPTLLGVSVYPNQAARQREMVEAVYAMRDQDAQGQQRSLAESPVGYTSYFTMVRMMELEPFMDLAAFITSRAHGYAQQQSFDLQNYDLVMSSFWVNITPRGAYHNDHIHPYSHISGVYYLSALPDSGDIIFKDPRPVRTMAMPPVAEKTAENSDVVTIGPAEGHVLMFPSWLTHGVKQNLTDSDRISLSFNFDLQPRSAPRPGGT